MIPLAEPDGFADQGVLAEFWEVFTDPAHILAEFASSLVWDVLVVLILLPLILKALARFKRSIHAEIDAEHGISHPVQPHADQAQGKIASRP